MSTLILAKDDTNTTRSVLCDSDGALIVGSSIPAGSKISIADYTTPANTLLVNTDGSINVNSSGSGSSVVKATTDTSSEVNIEGVFTHTVGGVNQYALSTVDYNNKNSYDANGYLETVVKNGANTLAIDAGGNIGVNIISGGGSETTLIQALNNDGDTQFLNCQTIPNGNFGLSVNNFEPLIALDINDDAPQQISCKNVSGKYALNTNNVSPLIGYNAVSGGTSSINAETYAAGAKSAIATYISNGVQIVNGANTLAVDAGGNIGVNIISGGGGGAGPLQATDDFGTAQDINCKAIGTNYALSTTITYGTNQLIVGGDGSIQTSGTTNLTGLDYTNTTRDITSSEVYNNGTTSFYGLNVNNLSSVIGTDDNNDKQVIGCQIVGTAGTGPVNTYGLSVDLTKITKNTYVDGLTTTTGLYSNIASSTNKLIDSEVYSTTKNALAVYTVNSASPTPVGVYNNIANNITLTAGSSTTALNINNTYGNESVLSYQDSSTTATGYVSIWGSDDNTNWFYIGVLSPTTIIRSSLRLSVSVLKLGGIKYIRLTSEESSASLNNVRATLVSG